MTEKNCFEVAGVNATELHIDLSRTIDNSKKWLAVSTYEVARRDGMIVRAGGDWVALYIDGRMAHKWINYKRAGYSVAQAAEILFREGEKKEER